MVGSTWGKGLSVTSSRAWTFLYCALSSAPSGAFPQRSPWGPSSRSPGQVWGWGQQELLPEHSSWSSVTLCAVLSPFLRNNPLFLVSAPKFYGAAWSQPGPHGQISFAPTR